MQHRDLPVSVDLDGVLADEVTSYVETEAGWQVVADDGPPPPILTLAAAARPGRACVVVVDGLPEPEVVRSALLAGALDVIGWPHDRARLLEAPLRVRSGGRGERGPGLLRVAGAAGGVGASTLTLALGGLLAWSGRRVLVVGGNDLLALCGLAPWAGPGVGELAVLDPADAAAEAAQLARAVPGVERLRVLGGGGAALGSLAGWPVDVVVTDLRVLEPAALLGARDAASVAVLEPPPPWLHSTPPAPAARAGLVAAHRADLVAAHRADLVVARPDQSLRALAGGPPDLPVVVLGEGPLDRPGVRRLLGRPPVGWLPASARVARAGLAGRVPAALPGTWIRELRGVMRRVRR
jgi:hypothetical protein